MKRAGFTMIELIFVIVIIGILAAVALPKLVGVQESARVAKAAELVSHMNSVIGPSLYAKALGSNGSIKTFIAAQTSPKNNLSYYMEIPTQFGTGSDMQACTISTSTGAAAAPILSDSTNSIYIYCRDGNDTDVPRFWYSTKTAGAANDFNISKASF